MFVCVVYDVGGMCGQVHSLEVLVLDAFLNCTASYIEDKVSRKTCNSPIFCSGDVSVLFPSPNTEVTGVQQHNHADVNLNLVLMPAESAFLHRASPQPKVQVSK